jgi:5-methylcytosine-specific restriction endonuclease McrA
MAKSIDGASASWEIGSSREYDYHFEEHRDSWPFAAPGAWRCDTCGKVSDRVLGAKNSILCFGCAEDIANLWWRELSGEWLTWRYPESSVRATTPKRAKIPGKLRRAVYERDHYRCRYCGGFERLSLDHVVPESRGGAATEENLVTACRTCNTRKGNRTLEAMGMSLLPIPLGATR